MGDHVLVGYDGSTDSENALRWAVREARLRGLALRVVYAWRWPYPVGYSDREAMAIVKRTGENLLDRGVRLARRLAPDLRVHRHLTGAPAYSGLMSEGHDAQLLVVGSHERGALSLGSTALRLPAHAHRPVVVVRTTGTRFGQAVVGVDSSPGSEAALAFAFEQAALRGWRLDAVHGCLDAGAAPEADLALFNDEARLRRVVTARLERAVTPWLDKYPQVDVRLAVVMRTPREAMSAAARKADLVVVGNRGADDLDPHRLGATGGVLLQYAPCTVAIVHAD